MTGDAVFATDLEAGLQFLAGARHDDRAGCAAIGGEAIALVGAPLRLLDHEGLGGEFAAQGLDGGGQGLQGCVRGGTRGDRTHDFNDRRLLGLCEVIA